MKYEMREEECFCGIQAFYDNVAIKMGLNPDNARYDCRKINVSNNIFDKIYEYYKQEEHIGMDQMGMMWVCFGPKCKDDLKGYEVMVEDGFAEEVE